MPGIDAAEFARRRQILADNLPENSIAMIVGYQLRFATGPVFHEFQQNTNVLYYTGFDEPNCLLLVPSAKNAVVPKPPLNGTSIFFCQDTIPKTGVEFHGTNIGPERARDHFGLETVLPASSLTAFLNQFFAKNPSLASIYTDIDDNSMKLPRDVVAQLTAARFSHHSLLPISHKQRLVKSHAELTLMRQSAKAASLGFCEAIKECRVGLEESHLRAVMEYHSRRAGAQGLAYAPVIAGGENALVLHYVKNRQLLRSGDLVLMDAGALLSHYRTDISRTWPVNRKFTDPQRKLYQAVLAVHRACIDMCIESRNNSINDIHSYSLLKFEDELKALGIHVSSRALQSIFYPHSIGHYLGLDLHDCPHVGTNLPLKAGTVVTIEPGLYIPKGSQFPEEYHGIGIRIEDDIVVGKEYPEILTSDVPSHVDDLTQLLNS